MFLLNEKPQQVHSIILSKELSLKKGKTQKQFLYTLKNQKKN